MKTGRLAKNDRPGEINSDTPQTRGGRENGGIVFEPTCRKAIANLRFTTELCFRKREKQIRKRSQRGNGKGGYGGLEG